MDNQHKHISGYRDLSPEDVAAINAVKAAEVALGEVWRSVAESAATDKRWVSVARTHFEEGFSALVRSIAQPASRF